MNVPVAALVGAVAPPDGTGWMPSSTVAPEIWSTPWQTGTADLGGNPISFSYRTHGQYLQVYVGPHGGAGGIRSYVARKFTMTVGAPDASDPLGTSSDVQTAANALLTYMAANGCPTTSNATVQAFQTAYNANLPMGQTGALALDGLYGTGTQAALQATLNAGSVQPPPTAPAACVTTAPLTTSPVATTAPSVGGWSPTAIVVATAGILGVSLVGYAVYRKHKRKESS
jgi:hypothetical protein